MSIFAHREDTRGWPPRHPIVCLLNIVGVCIAIGFFIHRPTPLFALLPFAVAVQYIASCVYHWRPVRKAWWTFDHLAIALLITATYVQFWIGALPSQAAYSRTTLLAAFAAQVAVIIIVRPNYNLLRGILYVVLTAIGLALSLSYPALLTQRGWIDFIAGIVMYGAQQLILAVESPDPVPKVFGYREVQHCFLLAASTTHLYVVARYLGP